MPLVQFKEATSYGGKSYRKGETHSLPDVTAARLVALRVAELVPGTPVSPGFDSLVEGLGKIPKPPAKRSAAPPPKVNVRLKAAAKVAGQLRSEGDLVAVDESRAAMLVVEGLADTPAGVSASFGEKVASFREFGAVMAKRQSGVQLATLL